MGVLRTARRNLQTKPLVSNNIAEIKTILNRVHCSHKLQRGSKSQTALGVEADVHRRLKKNMYLFGQLKVPSVDQQAQTKHRVGKKVASTVAAICCCPHTFCLFTTTTAAIQTSTNEGKLNQAS